MRTIFWESCGQRGLPGSFRHLAKPLKNSGRAGAYANLSGETTVESGGIAKGPGSRIWLGSILYLNPLAYRDSEGKAVLPDGVDVTFDADRLGANRTGLARKIPSRRFIVSNFFSR